MISRRSLISALATLPLSQIAEGQAPGPVHRVGIIYLTGYHHVVVDGLQQGLHELGLDEGKNLLLDVREIHDDPKMAGGGSQGS